MHRKVQWMVFAIGCLSFVRGILAIFWVAVQKAAAGPSQAVVPGFLRAGAKLVARYYGTDLLGSGVLWTLGGLVLIIVEGPWWDANQRQYEVKECIAARVQWRNDIAACLIITYHWQPVEASAQARKIKVREQQIADSSRIPDSIKCVSIGDSINERGECYERRRWSPPTSRPIRTRFAPLHPN